jgi:hypothetical protein
VADISEQVDALDKAGLNRTHRSSGVDRH